MRNKLTLPILFASTFILVLALWTVYYLGYVILKMPLWFVSVLAGLAGIASLMGIMIGIWIRSKRGR